MASGTNDLINLLLRLGWQGPQTGMGLVQGISRTGSLPRIEEGSLRFDTPPGTDPSAMGEVMMAPKGATPEEMKHERRHISQSRLLGPSFLPIHLLSQAQPYERQALERDAFRSEQPSHELLKQGPAGPPSALLEALLQRILGQ